MDARRSADAGAVQRCELCAQNLARRRVFVAQVDVNFGRVDNPRGDQHAFEKAVRSRLQDPAVFECAGLALVRVHRHKPRFRLRRNEAPLAAGGKSGATKAAQAALFDCGHDRLAAAAAVETRFQQGVAAGASIGIQTLVFRHGGRGLSFAHGARDRFRSGTVDRVLPDHYRRCRRAPPHARRAHDASAGDAHIEQ